MRQVTLYFGLVTLVGLASGCPSSSGSNPICGLGTYLNADATACVSGDVDMGCKEGTIVNGVCVLSPPPPTCTGCLTAGTDGKCVMTSACCAQGTQLNGTATGCETAKVQGSLLFSAKNDQVWATSAYNNNGTVGVLGDFYHLTATVPDSTPMFLVGIGPGSPFNAAAAAPFQFGNRAPTPIWWDANPANPSTTLSAIDHQITVGEWKTCQQTWSVYNHPVRTDNAHYYRFVVDETGCPANVMFGHWMIFSKTQYADPTGTDTYLGVPAGGLPNVVTTLADGTAHWERDMDPNVWLKSGVALNGNTHGQGPGQGKVPDLATFADASVHIATFTHNNGQSNGNAGWCASVLGSTGAAATTCGLTSFVANNVTPTSGALQVGATVAPYVYIPGNVGFDSVVSFLAGVQQGVSTNTFPLKNLQPY